MHFGSKEVIRSFGTLDFDFISSPSGDWLDTVRKAEQNWWMRPSAAPHLAKLLNNSCQI